jgi:hypothetical protein
MRSAIAPMIAVAGEIIDVVKMTPALAKAITVTADATRPFASIRAGQVRRRRTNAPRTITTAHDLAS